MNIMTRVLVRGFRRRNSVNPGTHKVRPSVRNVSSKNGKINYKTEGRVKSSYMRERIAKSEYLEENARSEFMFLAFQAAKDNGDIIPDYYNNPDIKIEDPKKLFYEYISKHNEIPTHVVCNSRMNTITIDINSDAEPIIKEMYKNMETYQNLKSVGAKNKLYKFDLNKYVAKNTGENRLRFTIKYNNKKDYNHDSLNLNDMPFTFMRGN